jgi:hypothetical protein
MSGARRRRNGERSDNYSKSTVDLSLRKSQDGQESKKETKHDNTDEQTEQTDDNNENNDINETDKQQQFPRRDYMSRDGTNFFDKDCTY